MATPLRDSHALEFDVLARSRPRWMRDDAASSGTVGPNSTCPVSNHLLATAGAYDGGTVKKRNARCTVCCGVTT